MFIYPCVIPNVNARADSLWLMLVGFKNLFVFLDYKKILSWFLKKYATHQTLVLHSHSALTG